MPSQHHDMSPRTPRLRVKESISYSKHKGPVITNGDITVMLAGWLQTESSYKTPIYAVCSQLFSILLRLFHQLHNEHSGDFNVIIHRMRRTGKTILQMCRKCASFSNHTPSHCVQVECMVRAQCRKHRHRVQGTYHARCNRAYNMVVLLAR